MKKEKSYGMISASRVQSTGQHMFGSDIEHSTYISLTISNAEYNEEFNNPIQSAEQLIRVRMSAVQWADLLTNMNTLGVPCTIERIQGETIESYKPLTNKLDTVFRKGKQYLENTETKGLLNEVRDVIANSKLNKKDKSKLEVVTRNLDETLKSNASFYLRRFKEEAENIFVDSKAEVESNKNYILQKLGELKLNELKQLE